MTNTYIGKATRNYNILLMYQIGLALKPCQKNAKMVVKRDKEKINRTRFLGLLTEFSPREEHGPVAI